MNEITVARPKYELASVGLHPAIVTEIIRVDDEEFGGEGLRFVFDLIDEQQEDGYAKRVFRTTNLKLTPKSALLDVITSILGRQLNDQELHGFNVSQLRDLPVYIDIKREVCEPTGQPYAKIESIVHVPRGPAFLVEPTRAQREAEREAEREARQNALPF